MLYFRDGHINMANDRSNEESSENDLQPIILAKILIWLTFTWEGLIAESSSLLVSNNFAMTVITVPKSMARITKVRGRIWCQKVCKAVPDGTAFWKRSMLMQQAGSKSICHSETTIREC